MVLWRKVSVKLEKNDMEHKRFLAWIKDVSYRMVDLKKTVGAESSVRGVEATEVKVVKETATPASRLDISAPADSKVISPVGCD